MDLNLPSKKKLLSFLRTWYLVGILGFAFPITYEVFRHLIPVNLLLMALVIVFYHRPFSRRFLLLTFAVVLLGFGIEVAGVKTGWVFGEYAYGRILGPRIAGVPVIIGLNWVIMVYGGLAISSLTGLGILPVSLLSALLITLSDLIIERFAMLTGMWTWAGGNPPLRNFLGWYLVSFIFSLLYFRTVQAGTRKVAIYIYIYQMILFIVTLITALFWQ